MSKFTQGQWTHAEPWNFDGTFFTYVYPGVARVQGNTEEECNANARLIAAAPELLEALKRIVHNGYIDNAPTSIYDEAFAAISKAEGE